VRFQEVEAFDGYRALRQGDIDVLCNWLAVDESDLTAARRPRRGRDLRPIPLGLVWSAGRDNARRALEDVARSMSPLPPAA
jgi:hypothetical protein